MKAGKLNKSKEIIEMIDDPKIKNEVDSERGLIPRSTFIESLLEERYQRDE